MSVNIKLVRIDKRLLHATVALNWNQFIDADVVVVVDPLYVEDPFITKVMQLCLPKTTKVKFFSVEKFLEFLHTDKNLKAMIIFTNIEIAYEAVRQGFMTKEIQMPYPAVKIIVKKLSDYFNEQEIKHIRFIVQKGIKMYFQTSPFDSKDYSVFKLKE